MLAIAAAASMLAAAILLVSLLSGERPGPSSLAITSLAAIVVLLGVAPSATYYASSFRKTFPLLELFFLFCMVGYGLPALNDRGFRLRPDDDGLAAALALVIAGMLSVWAGYQTFRCTASQSIPALRFPKLTTYAAFERVGWLSKGFHILYVLLSLSGFVAASVVQLADLLGVLGTVVLSWLLFAGHLSRFGRIALVLGVMPVEIIVAIAGGALTPFVRLVVLIIAVYVHVRRRLPMLAVVGTAALFVLLSPVKQEFRKASWGAGEQDSAIAKVATFSTFAYRYWTSPAERSSMAAVDQLAERADLSGLLGYAMEQTPAVVPYLKGETLTPLAYYWIPRFIWRDKPLANLGNEWAHWYGIIGAADDITSWNLPWIVEFYINYGILGVVVGMFIIGCLFSVVETLFRHGDNDPVAYCVGMTIVLQLWLAESNIALSWGNIVTKMVVAVLVIRVMLSTHFQRDNGGRSLRTEPAAA